LPRSPCSTRFPYTTLFRSGRLPLKLLIVDEHTIFVEEPGAHRPRAIVTANRSVVALAAALFEQLWAAAVPAPVRGAGGSAIGEEDGKSTCLNSSHVKISYA